MKYIEFVALVRQRGRIDNDQEAERAIEATFQTLAQRLYDGEVENLAAQLPKEFKGYLSERKPKKLLNLDEFYRRVSQREAVGYPEVRRHARAVMAAVVQSVSPGELENVLDQLPDEFTELFTLGLSEEYRDL